MFPSICTTHTYDDRVATARLAIDAGMELCCGGILGMGETLEQRIDFAFELAELDAVRGADQLPRCRRGTPLGEERRISPREALQAIALFRLVLPERVAAPRRRPRARARRAPGDGPARRRERARSSATTSRRAADPPRRTSRCSTRSACPSPTARAKAASSSTPTARTRVRRSRRARDPRHLRRRRFPSPFVERRRAPGRRAGCEPRDRRRCRAAGATRSCGRSRGRAPTARAALIGDTWLTAIDRAVRRATPRQQRCHARRHPLPHGARGSPHRAARSRRRRCQLSHDVGRQVRERAARRTRRSRPR